MGDRCGLKVWTNKSNVKKFLEVFEVSRAQVDIEKVSKDQVSISFEEINYGGIDELAELAKTCEFAGFHLQGESYGAYKFFSPSGSEDVVYQEYGDCGYCISFGLDGKPLEGAIDKTVDFIAKYNSMIKGEVRGEE